jgi:glutathione S-transferase
MRARLALAVTGTRCELREVVLRDKPDAMLAASPKGTVPVLVLHDGTVIDQSLDIMHWALRRNDPEGWFERADADLIAKCDGPFKQDLDRYKYPDRHGSDASVSRDKALAFVLDLELRLSASEQLCGDRRGLADAAIMPFVRQFAAVDPAWFADQPMPHVRRWLSDHLASDLFTSVMMRYPPWAPGDPQRLVFAD